MSVKYIYNSCLCQCVTRNSRAIAERLKIVLDKLVSKCQTGFIKGRYIGESTRLIYDIMNYTEVTNKNGLLMLIDFEKAFDSISWKFMYK